jgi:S-(hydroxymethyl)glutathione dehydrogenase/alcohol dehydrogenase
MIPSEALREQLGLPDPFPLIGGHEGAGVVVEVGPGVTSVQPGDHVSASFIPSCGRCRYCSTGRQNLCDLGGGTFMRGQITDGTSRHFIGDQVNLMAKARHLQRAHRGGRASVIKVDPTCP